jgi:hypothetical protein
LKDSFDHDGGLAGPGWLTAELKRRGHLRSGAVTRVEQHPAPFLVDGRTGTARFWTVDVDFSAGSDHSCPSHFLLKTCLPHRYEMNRTELDFYSAMAEVTPPEGLVTVFGMADDPQTQSTALLMQDLGPDQQLTEWPIPPQMPICERAVTTLATVHATWWNHPRLADAPFELYTAEKIDRQLQHEVLPAAQRFVHDLGDNLSKARRDYIDRFIARYPDVFKRRIATAPFQTLCHGDPHFWNFAIPESEEEPVTLLDWQLWKVDFGAWDLAYMIAHHWFPDRRRQFERPLMAHYRAVLRDAGVTYSETDLDLDYRLSVLRNIVHPILCHELKFDASVWWPHLDRVFSAIDDLDCLELLD